MIRIRSLSISFFRGIREGKIDSFADVNILVGRNNSGKTTIVEAIQRAATVGGLQNDLFGRPVDQFWRQVRADVPAVGGVPDPSADEQRVLWYRQDVTKEIVISALLQEDGDREKSEELKYIKVHPQNPAALTKGAPPATPRRIISGVHGPQRKNPFWAGITVFRPPDAFNVKIEQQFWPQLLSDRRDRLLTQALNDVFGLNAEALQLLPNNQFLVLFPDYSLPLDSQGDGARAAVRTLMTLSMLKGTLLMLEEPECNQHPGSLERFAAALCKLAKNQAVQIIVSTHSAECVRSFLQAASAAKSEGAVFHLALSEGKLDARRLDPEAVEALTTTGIDVRFLDLYA